MIGRDAVVHSAKSGKHSVEQRTSNESDWLTRSLQGGGREVFQYKRFCNEQLVDLVDLKVWSTLNQAV
ncbi:hypothetical protein CLIM01_15001 [Colletotrichum limetticola]|uniref:Uncharacterized protein n=1 Tax=Colletotrichum limetticola TaxID=1209924 RepID=A0ABQ9P6X1_9PEZI|nr:hypothetical protein CLIM01_15001 [Colletotrichum limetticola]